MKRRLAHIAAIAAAALLLAGCSSVTRLAYDNVRTLYSNAAPMLTWMVDDYVDISGSQKDWVRERIDRALEWHRAQELPEYRRFLESVAVRAEGNFTEDEVRITYAELNSHYKRAVEHLLPDVADFLLQLDSQQVAQLGRKFDKDNTKVVQDSVKGGVGERNQRRLERTLVHIEEWTGDLADTQKELVASHMRAFRDLTDERVGDRRYRQVETLALIRGKPTREQAIAVLRRLLIETDSWRRPEYTQKLRERNRKMFAMIAELSATLTPQQRSHLQDRLRGYQRDLSRLSAAG